MEDEVINPTSLPVYQKRKEILDVVFLIADLIPDNNKVHQSVKGF